MFNLHYSETIWQYQAICYTFEIMKARHRAPFFWTLILGLLGSVLIAYLHFGLFPGRLKFTAVRTIDELTQTKVDFDKVLVLPVEGLSLHNLTVRDKSDHLLFSAKKLAVNIRLIPFLKEKKIIVTNVFLENPVYDAVLRPKKIVVSKPPPMTQISGQIPIPVATDEKKIDFESIEEGPDFFLPENVYLEQIEIVNGFVSIRNRPEDPVTEEVRSINVRLTFQRPPELAFDGFVRLGHDPYAQIGLKGSWNLKTGIYAFYLQTRSTKIPDWLLEYQKDHFLILKKGRFMLETRLSSIGDGKAFFKSHAQIYDSEIHLRSTEYSGRMNIDTKGLFNTDTKTFERYKGGLEFVDVNVKNLSEKIRELKDLKGKIAFQSDLLTMNGVAGRYRNLAFRAYGTLASFKDLKLNAMIHTDSKISEVLALLSDEQKKMIGNLKLQGDCKAITTVRGTLRNSKALEIDYRIVVNNGSVSSPDKKVNISDISAQISVNESGYRINNARFMLADKPYFLNASIPKASQELRTCDLRSKDFDLHAVYSLDNNTFLIKEAVAHSFGASSTFYGRMSNLNDPYLDVQGNTEIILDRAKTLLSSYAPALKSMDLQGALIGPFSLKGLWNKPLNWDLSADLTSDSVIINKNIRLEKLETHLRMKDRIINIPYFHAYPYHGTLGMNLWMDPSRAKIPFEGKIFGNKIDLNALAKDLPMKEKDFSGIAAFQVNLKGGLGDPDSYLGDGSLNIHDGKLWRTDLFKAMGKLPFLTVEGLDDVTFHDLTGTFNIHDRRLWTEDLNLISDPVDLALNGSIGFDQSIDMLMNIRYSKNILLGAMDTGGFAPFIVNQAGDFISKYRISGTLKQPKYDKTEILPISRVIGKKITSLLGGSPQ